MGIQFILQLAISFCFGSLKKLRLSTVKNVLEDYIPNVSSTVVVQLKSFIFIVKMCWI